jgi:hypothetical protein
VTFYLQALALYISLALSSRRPLHSTNRKYRQIRASTFTSDRCIFLFLSTTSFNTSISFISMSSLHIAFAALAFSFVAFQPTLAINGPNGTNINIPGTSTAAVG